MKIIGTLAIAVALLSPTFLCGQQLIKTRLDAMSDPRNTKVYVVAHRGDWRDAPENSIRSLKWAGKVGADVVEFDLKKTKDGKLVVMHDPSLNRTTTGTGLVSDHTFEELKKLKLRAGTGHPTDDTIPTFAEELDAARENGLVLDIDQGWDYFSDVVAQVREAHAIDRVIINVFPNTSYTELQKRVGDIPDDETLMIVVNMARADSETIIQSYEAHKKTIVQCIFADAALPSVQHISTLRNHFPIFINSLWPDQNANHDDDRAVSESSSPDQTWGWLIAHGASIIQTDRPRELTAYLNQKHLR